MASARQLRAAARLLRALGDGACALAGGLAVNAHGYVRATRDVDVIVNMPLDEARRRLAGARIATTVFKGDPLDGDFPCLKGMLGGVPFDVLPQLVPFDAARTLTLRVGDLPLRIVDLDTLFRLKLKAGGPKDLLDVATLAHLHPGGAEQARALAERDAQLLARLRQWLDDPRVAAAAREIRRQERAARRRR